MIRVDIFVKGRFIGQLKIKDRWHGIVSIDEEELRNEIETRLPALHKSNDYTIAFA